MNAVKRAAKREAMRRWRERHPILALWHNHKSDAKRRGISVEWTPEEFRFWCITTGYHITVRDGMSIDRIDPARGYSLDNVQLLTVGENSAKGNRERLRRRYEILSHSV